MIYYIADMHFGHTNVLRFDNRPFSDTAQMDDTLLQNWNERVTADDQKQLMKLRWPLRQWITLIWLSITICETATTTLVVVAASLSKKSSGSWAFSQGYGKIKTGDEKMLERGKMDRDRVEFVVIDQLVPAEQLLRKIDAAVDFNALYEMVEPLYCEDNGRPSIDPVVLFKMVLIQHLYGLPSLRRTADEVSANICYRWFLGYTLQEETPHFSTVSYNFRHRFTAETADTVFAWILSEVAEAGYLSPRAVFIDGTHIKANANTKKQVKEQIPAAARHYAKELMDEVNADREAHGRKPFDDDNDHPTSPKKPKDNTSKKKLARRKKEKKRTATKSVTDPECGLFVKGEHKKQFAYEAHTACDGNGFVLETVVTPAMSMTAQPLTRYTTK